MTSGDWARLIPPFVLGAALTVASVVSAGLLLYGGVGFLGALSVLLATLFGALAAGVAAGRRRRGRGPVEALRRRWLLTLVAFTLAALFAAGWEGFQGFGALAFTQGVGLALLVALPHFAGGAVLGTLSKAPGLAGGPGGTGPIALAGAGAGALALGFVLFPVFSPTAIFLVCLVTLSGAALVQGWVLDDITWVVEAKGEPPAGTARAERWVRGRPPLTAIVVTEGGRLRAMVREGGEAFRAGDQAILEGLESWASRSGRSLVLGSGGAVVARHLAEVARNRGQGSVTVVEPEPLLRALRPVLGPFANGDDAPLGTRSLDVHDVLSGSPAHLPPAAFDLVILDTLAVAPTPADFEFPNGSLIRLRSTLRPGGILIVGPLQEGGRAGSLLDRARHLSVHFSRLSLYVAGRASRVEAAHVPFDRLEEWRSAAAEEGTRPAFLVAGLGGTGGWPDRVAGYLRVMLEEPGRTR